MLLFSCQHGSLILLCDNGECSIYSSIGQSSLVGLPHTSNSTFCSIGYCQLQSSLTSSLVHALFWFEVSIVTIVLVKRKPFRVDFLLQYILFVEKQNDRRLLKPLIVPNTSKQFQSFDETIL